MVINGVNLSDIDVADALVMERYNTLTIMWQRQ